MQHTLVAVFDNRTDAQNAMNELLSSGFTRTDVRLSNADPTGQTDSLTGRSDLNTERSHDGDTGITASIKNFFSDLFGSDNAEHVSRYEGAVTRGHHVLTLVASSLPEVERGADIVERYGPTDIDENTTGTPDLATGGISAGAMRMGSSTGMQQSSSMSAQSGSLGNVQAAPTPRLDNPGERELFQQGSLNQGQTVGGTHQESLGTSGLTATGGTSLQSSTLRDDPVQNAPFDSSQQGGLSAGSAQLDNDRIAAQGSNLGSTASAGSTSSLQGSALDGSIRSDSLQRDTQAGSLSGGASSLDKQRSGVRIFSRGQSDAALGLGGSAGSASSTMGSDDDDGYYRNHFNTTYGATGAAYDDYLPAYSYGSEAARSGRYTNRAWDDIETDLHSDWDSRYANGGEPSTWEKMKAAVRHGWERMTRDDDDDLYRGHYDSTYASSGTRFEELKPAYAYGSEARRSELYRNQPWDDVEGTLRTGWDNRIDGTRDFSTTGSDTSEPSAWDRVKNAVRHGWDRMTDDNDDDVYYRNHWNTTYGAAGGAYDEYRPAYSYGSEMARNDQYRGRSWDAVETDLRSDWDRRYPGDGGPSTWDKMKSAVRRGWDRMTDDDNDAYYRNHWNSVYGAGGEAYDEYRPAYSYGSEMALNDKYRGRPWNDVETDLRSDWDTRYPGEQSTWEKMKSAVRHGWDRMMR
ncbi:general stress protein [Massilia sp. CFBP9012]|uniref:general stress protein n=1 Tax=Massilia sp. CFBP9012 TaxID=3096531 RepID=UPI002A698866|nr:general stress protein [Massilia sp. CFBP9012]MDY0975599.1 general stress protein [Massilia sp. CFBP9012]